MRIMADRHRISELAGAAGFLCSARDELAAAGYSSLVRQLRGLIEMITLEIAWLEHGGDDTESPGFPS
jgi:hypothetical protein